jgi:hypoxanthine phosphoribosyltransferase
MKKLVIPQREFDGYINEICRSITNSNWRPDYIVGITRGGLLPALMISQYFNIKMNSLDISLRDGGDCVSNLGMAEDAFNGKNILIVDDINDTGATLNWLMKDWPSGCFPDDEKWSSIWNYNVRFAVVVDNVASKCNVQMDYFSFEVNKAEDDVWIEFPYEEWWKK